MGPACVSLCRLTAVQCLITCDNSFCCWSGSSFAPQTNALALVQSSRVTESLFAPAVRGLLQGLLPPGEPQDAPALPHWGEALRVRARGLQQGLLQRLGPGQAPEPHTLQRGTGPQHFQESSFLARFLVSISMSRREFSIFKINAIRLCVQLLA